MFHGFYIGNSRTTRLTFCHALLGFGVGFSSAIAALALSGCCPSLKGAKNLFGCSCSQNSSQENDNTTEQNAQ